MKTVALIVAGGKSERFGGEVPKQFREVAGKPLLSWTISRFERAESITQIVVVVPEEYLLYTSETVIDPYKFMKVAKVVIGGQSRRESVLNGLNALSISTNYVAIHDGARPMILPEDINRAVGAAVKDRAVIIAAKATDTIKHVKQGHIISTLDRETLYMAQTPQVFQYDLIMEAHRGYAEGKVKREATDDASLIERGGIKVKVLEPSGYNFKVTTVDDMLLAETILRRERDGQ